MCADYGSIDQWNEVENSVPTYDNDSNNKKLRKENIFGKKEKGKKKKVMGIH